MTVHTRFDQGILDFDEKPIRHQETLELLDSLKFIFKHPLEVQMMIIEDIEQLLERPGYSRLEIAGAIKSATSMNIAQTLEYFATTDMATAMLEELSNRGVNSAQYLENVRQEAMRWHMEALTTMP